MPSIRNVSLAIGLFACAPGATPFDDSITLTASPVVLPAGDSVTVILATTLEGGVGYNLCSSALERQSGYDWQVVPADRVCTMELRTLQPGEEATFTFHLPVTLEPGEYRYHARVEALTAGEMHDVRTEPFTVN